MKGRVLLAVTPTGYAPADDEARAQHAKQTVGDHVMAKVERPRSLPQLRLYWSVLHHVAASSHWESAERLHVALKVRMGLYDLCKLPNGKVVPVVNSVSFDAKNQDEFQAFMDKALAVLCEESLGGMAVADLIAEVCAATGTPLPERRVA
jgi:hypothetical protein